MTQRKEKMENNIFENAYFDKRYKTRDGRKAVYIEDSKKRGYRHLLAIEGNKHIFTLFDNEGFCDSEEHPFDIVGEWQEEITEEELDDLATNEAINRKDEIATSYLLTKENRDYVEQFIMEGYRYGYYAGYRKAKEL